MTSGSVGAGEGVVVLDMGPDILWFDIGVPQHIGRFPPCIGFKVINYSLIVGTLFHIFAMSAIK